MFSSHRSRNHRKHTLKGFRTAIQTVFESTDNEVPTISQISSEVEIGEDDRIQTDDVKHDFFEGDIPVELSLCLSDLISKVYITLEGLNHSIKTSL